MKMRKVEKPNLLFMGLQGGERKFSGEPRVNRQEEINGLETKATCVDSKVEKHVGRRVEQRDSTRSMTCDLCTLDSTRTHVRPSSTRWTLQPEPCVPRVNVRKSRIPARTSRFKPMHSSFSLRRVRTCAWTFLWRMEALAACVRVSFRPVRLMFAQFSSWFQV